MRKFCCFLFILTLPLFTSCHSTQKKIKVAASSVPHAEILEHIKEELKGEGVALVIVEVDDYALPNRLLNERVVDANFFQHIPYLEAEKKNFGYDFTWIAKVHFEPLTLYSTKIEKLDELGDRAVIGIPNDPSNETRALKLLQKWGLIRLKEQGNNEFLTILDISENPHHLKIEELDAGLLSHLLPDVDGAVIPGNYALRKQDQMHILARESSESEYANVLVIRTSDDHREELLRLAALLNSEEMRDFILRKYQGRLLPAF